MNNYGAEPAPELTAAGRCSTCSIHAIWIANNELRICPKCYALLWHANYPTQARPNREKYLAEQHERAAARKAVRDAERNVLRAINALARADARDRKL